jgi:hypothetical protein
VQANASASTRLRVALERVADRADVVPALAELVDEDDAWGEGGTTNLGSRQ